MSRGLLSAIINHKSPARSLRVSGEDCHAQGGWLRWPGCVSDSATVWTAPTVFEPDDPGKRNSAT